MPYFYFYNVSFFVYIFIISVNTLFMYDMFLTSLRNSFDDRTVSIPSRSNDRADTNATNLELALQSVTVTS